MKKAVFPIVILAIAFTLVAGCAGRIETIIRPPAPPEEQPEVIPPPPPEKKPTAIVPAVKGLQRILKRGVLRVGTTGDQPPFSARTKTGKVIGLDMDIADRMATAMGVKLKIISIAFRDLIPALQAGRVDMVISGMSLTPKRNLKVAFAGPYLITGKGILTKNKHVAASKTAGHINKTGITVTALANSTSQRYVEKMLPRTTLTPAKSLDDAVGLLLSDQVDVLVADHPYCAVTAYRYKAQGLMAGRSPFTAEPLGIAIPPTDFLLVNWTDNFLKTLKTNGDLEAIQNRWFKDAIWIESLP